MTRDSLSPHTQPDGRQLARDVERRARGRSLARAVVTPPGTNWSLPGARSPTGQAHTSSRLGRLPAYAPTSQSVGLPAAPTTAGRGYASSSRFFCSSGHILRDAFAAAVMLGSLRDRFTRDRLGSALLPCTALHCTVPYCAAPRHATPRRTAPRRATPRHAVPCRAVPYRTAPVGRSIGRSIGRSCRSDRIVVVVASTHARTFSRRSLHARPCGIADAHCCFLAILATVNAPGAAILYTDTCFAASDRTTTRSSDAAASPAECVPRFWKSHYPTRGGRRENSVARARDSVDTRVSRRALVPRPRGRRNAADWRLPRAPTDSPTPIGRDFSPPMTI